MEIYADVSEAEDYFDTRLNTARWNNISEATKLKALQNATRIINTLKFKGTKIDASQELEFPRIIYDENTDALIPLDTIPEGIKIAEFEIAYSLLEGIDPNKEIANIASESRSYASTKIVFDRTFVHEYIRAGVPSATAWSYLKPYLVSPSNINLVRIN